MPTQRIPDPYATLGVGREATASQLRTAYRRLAKRYHPDVHADAHASEDMKRVNQAWEILSSPSRRAEYDTSTAARADQVTRGHWAGAPRRAPTAHAAATSWTAAYGARPVHAGAGTYVRDPASGAYADSRSGGAPGPLLGATLLLIIPVAVLSAVILSGGILPFPLLGFLLLVFAGRVLGREG